jgi:hypothetical protein
MMPTRIDPWGMARGSTNAKPATNSARASVKSGKARPRIGPMSASDEPRRRDFASRIALEEFRGRR